MMAATTTAAPVAHQQQPPPVVATPAPSTQVSEYGSAVPITTGKKNKALLYSHFGLLSKNPVIVLIETLNKVF